MHLVGCRFPLPFWKPFVENQDANKLKTVAKDLLKKMNKKDQTPVLKELDKLKLNFRAISRLFESGILDKQSFEGHEDEIINLFSNYFVKQYADQANRDKEVMKKDKFFGTF